VLGKKHNLPVINDLGSGIFIPTTGILGYREPTVQDSVRAGASLTCFSGDKMLGGVQAGLIVGESGNCLFDNCCSFGTRQPGDKWNQRFGLQQLFDRREIPWFGDFIAGHSVQSRFWFSSIVTTQSISPRLPPKSNLKSELQFGEDLQFPHMASTIELDIIGVLPTSGDTTVYLVRETVGKGWSDTEIRLVSNRDILFTRQSRLTQIRSCLVFCRGSSGIRQPTATTVI